MICSVEKIISNERVVKEIYKLSVKIVQEVKPGQFFMLKPISEEVLLPRPISVNDVEGDKITFLYAVVGKGTKLMSKLKKRDSIQIHGPLGNGFDISKINGKIAIVSGGIGIAPMYYLLKRLNKCEVDFYAGFKNEAYFTNNIEKITNKLYIATENGKKGYKGFIIDIFEPQLYDLIICCGPKIMIQKVVSMCRAPKVPILILMENIMACGIGACLGCICKTKDGNKRTCKEGPVFRGEDLIFDA